MTISAGGNSRVLNVSDGSATSVPVSISNLTITGGNSVGDLVSETGGGIRNEETLSLSSATLTGNVGASGGGFGNVGGMVMMTDVTFDSNMAYSRGGGLHNTAGGYLSITNGVISGNTVTSATMYSTVAGGLSSYGVGSAVVLTDSMVTGNLAAHDDTMYAASGLLLGEDAQQHGGSLELRGLWRGSVGRRYGRIECARKFSVQFQHRH